MKVYGQWGLPEALNAALHAGAEIMKIYNSNNFNVQLKEDFSPLTQADINANTIIAKILATTNIPILSEESDIPDFEERKNWQKFWLIDPIDGTKEFISKNGEFTVNIALIENNYPSFGVIYAPALDVMYFSTSEGVRKTTITNQISSAEEIIEESELLPIVPSGLRLKIGCSRSFLNKETMDYINELNQEGIENELVQVGSSLKFCLMAEGIINYYPRIGKTMEWDVAAGQAIVEAAGYKMVVLNTDIRIVYNKTSLLNPDFLVYK